MDLRKLAIIKGINTDMTNSGDTRIDMQGIDRNGMSKRGKKMRMNSPIQPTQPNPYYVKEKKDYPDDKLKLYS